MSSPAYGLTTEIVLHALHGDDSASGRASYPIGLSASDRETSSGMLSLEEQHTVARIRAGDESTLETLYLQYYSELYVIVSTMMRTAMHADEVINDVFTALWRLRAEWAPVYGIRAYLVRAVRNRSRNVLRAESSRSRVYEEAETSLDDDVPPGMGEPSPIPDAQLEADDLARIVWNVIGRLSEPAQLVLSLRWRHGMSWDAIAHAMGLSVGAAQMHHTRACAVLRQRLPKHLK